MEIIDYLKKRIASFDYLMLILVIGLSIFGIIVVGSATHIQQFGTSEEFEKQKLWVITGLVLLLLAAFIDYRFICKFYILAYVLNIGLLLVAILVDSGVHSTVSRSIKIGGFSIQPSEFAKIFMLIFLAQLVDKLEDKLNNILILAGIGVAIIIPVYLIKEQPSLSASLVVLTVSVVVLFVGGLSFKYVIPTLAIGVPAAFLFIQDILREDHRFVHLILTPYQLEERLLPFFRPESADPSIRYQTEQSLRAIGSGMLSGKGLYQGTLNSLSYVPSNHNDFIFAVIGEEFGYVGGICLLAVLFVIILKCLYTAFKAPTLSGKLIATGVGFMLTFQTFVNVGVATGALPNTGMALPFISYGGSSMWVNMIAIGLVINVGMAQPKRSTFTLFEE